MTDKFHTDERRNKQQTCSIWKEQVCALFKKRTVAGSTEYVTWSFCLAFKSWTSFVRDEFSVLIAFFKDKEAQHTLNFLKN